jgi:hypothetical protein
MRARPFFFAACSCVFATLATAAGTTAVDTYHGVRVEDPYRWLENASDPKVQQWSQSQTIAPATTWTISPLENPCSTG